MDHKKILQIEEEIKNLFYNANIKKYHHSNADAKEFYQLFWNVHIKPVIKYSKQMAEKYNADLEAVWLGAILHDIARLTDEEPHDEIGSEKAYEILLKNGIDNNLSEKVKAIVLTHRCKKYLPETLEQKIVASADAMAHFMPPFYIWFAKYSSKTFEEILNSSLKKIERDYNDKIFFKDEKELVIKEYEILKKWCGYSLNE